MASFVIRNAVHRDIPTLLEMLKSVRRMVAFEYELEAWMKLDKEAIFVAVAENGEVVGSCSGLALTEDRGFLGLYVVKAQFRGKGIGSQLFSAAMRHLGDRNIGICGRDSTFEVYKYKHGFTFIPDYSLVYYECQNPKILSAGDCVPKWNIVDCDFDKDKLLVSEIIQYDLNLHRYSTRSSIVTNTLSEPGCKCIVAQLDDRTILGYVCIRPVITGHLLVAPFYADSSEVAKSLLRSAVAGADFCRYPDGLVVRSPSTNHYCEEMYRDFGFRNVDLIISTAYTKSLIDVPVSKIYSFHSVIFCAE